MPLSFLWSAQVSVVIVLRRPLLPFVRFQGLAHAFEGAVRLLVVASLDVTPLVVVVVVVVVIVVVILLAADEVLFPHAPALTPTVALAVVALFLS